MGTKVCCKTSTTNPDKEMKFDDATKNNKEDSDEEVYDNSKIEQHADEETFNSQNHLNFNRFEENKIKNNSESHMNNFNNIRFNDNLSSNKISKIPLEVILEEHSFEKIVLSPNNEQIAKNMFDSAFDEKFKVKEKESKGSAYKKYNKKTKDDLKNSKNPKNSISSLNEDVQEQLQVELPSPVHIRKDKKLDGPYVKGDWRTLNIKSIIASNVLNSSNAGLLILVKLYRRINFSRRLIQICK